MVDAWLWRQLNIQRTILSFLWEEAGEVRSYGLVGWRTAGNAVALTAHGHSWQLDLQLVIFTVYEEEIISDLSISRWQPYSSYELQPATCEHGHNDVWSFS